jgi:hypothetical protein
MRIQGVMFVCKQLEEIYAFGSVECQMKGSLGWASPATTSRFAFFLSPLLEFFPIELSEKNLKQEIEF